MRDMSVREHSPGRGGSGGVGEGVVGDVRDKVGRRMRSAGFLAGGV